MAHVNVAPDIMTSAAVDLETIGSTLEEAHRLVAPATLEVAPAAGDEVSASIADLFSQHAQDYQAVANEAAAYQEQFAQNLKAGAVSYASAEDIAAALLQGLETARLRNSSITLGLLVDYAAWATTWVDSIPGPLQPYVYLPVLFYLLDAFVAALFFGVIEAGVISIFGPAL